MDTATTQDDTDRDVTIVRVLAVAVVLLALVSLYVIFTQSLSPRHRAARGQAVRVADLAGLQPSDEYVAVILDDGAGIDEVLRRAGLSQAVPTGGGTYVIALRGAGRQAVIGRLKGDRDVSSVGRVFDADTRPGSP